MRSGCWTRRIAGSSSPPPACRCCHCPGSSTAPTSAACTNWRIGSRNRVSYESGPQQAASAQASGAAMTGPKLDLGPVLADNRTKIVVTCGSGGVGKTTTAAAMALWAADAGRKVAVLTIDPAKRLAQALGLAELDNDPRRVEIDLPAGGELWAMMLDT